MNSSRSLEAWRRGDQPSRPIRDLIAKGSPAHILREAAIDGGMSTLWDEGLKKVRAGLTSLEELEAVILLDH